MLNSLEYFSTRSFQTLGMFFSFFLFKLEWNDNAQRETQTKLCSDTQAQRVRETKHLQTHRFRHTKTQRQIWGQAKNRSDSGTVSERDISFYKPTESYAQMHEDKHGVN